MQNATGIPLIHPRTENVAVYVVLLVLTIISFFVLPTLLAKITALILLAAFGLLHTFGYRNAQRPWQIAGYFAAQTVVVTLLAWRASPSDAFAFLFFILGVQAMMLYPIRFGVSWLALFYLIDSASAVITYGRQGFINALFNLAVYLFTGFLGYAIQAAETARRRNLQLLTELQAAQQQVKALAVAEERNRLAREIHDGLGHYLTATTMQVQGAKVVLESTGADIQAPLAVGALNKAEMLLQEALIDVRRSVAALRGIPDAQRSLLRTLADLVNQQRSSDGLDVKFDVTGVAKLLNSQVELTLYRVAQEGLTNVRKHAQANHVAMALDYGADSVRLAIGDDGKGCATAAGGYGLLGLRERVQIVGGSVTICTAVGQGFQLLVEIPVGQ